LQLRGALLQAAWWAGAAEETADASERALAIAQEHERSAGRSVDAGTAAPLAHLQAQTDVVRRESDVVRARAERQRSWLALGVLLGEPRPVRVTLPAEPASNLATTEQLTRDALDHRPELRSLEASLRAAQWQVDSAWWRLAPQLSASGSAFASNIAYVTGDKVGWRASVDLTWALYDGGFRYGKHAQAEGQLASARAGLGAQKLEVSQQVLDASRDLEVAKERLRLAVRQKALAEEVAASAKRSFSAGLASSLDVLDANDRLYQADVGQAEARARLGMASAALSRVTGALLEGGRP
jgi:outer membrane protein TolC